MNGPLYVLEAPALSVALPEVRNHTQFPSQYLQALDVDDNVFHILVSRLTYDLARLDEQGTPQLAETQNPLVASDEFYVQPNTSSLIQESDFLPYKPACDILFARATAYAPDDKPVQRWPVGARIGNWHKMLAVCGPRTIRPGALGWSLSDPQPATQVPVRYELAFGGTSQWPEELEDDAEPEILSRHEFNPVGSGWLDKDWLRKRKPPALRGPQIEVFKDVFNNRWLNRQDYPVVGLGAIGKWWKPRLALAGTYDGKWKEERWPRLPKDFDFAYWNSAPKDQQIAYPKGGEDVLLVGLTPGGGQFKAKIPGNPPFSLVRLQAGPILSRPMHLDTLTFDMKNMTLTCVHRMTVAANAGVRVLEIRRKET